MADLTGKIIEERYKIEEKIGEGGMAFVYKSYDMRLDREVAIKFIRRDSISNDRYEIFLLRFNQEAKTLAKIAHPNIINVYDFGNHDSSPYFVMEYMSGGSLKRHMGKPIPWQKSLEWILPIARALDYAHQQGVVHRDVKPANMLMSKDGDLKLSDFGIAKILATEENNATTLTSSGGIGTPEYMAPEQWKNVVSSQTDIYALGVVLYELITGHKPYIANTPAEILIKQVNDPFPKIKSFAPNVPDEVDWLINKAMAKDPHQRFSSMKTFADAIQKALQGKEIPEYSPSVTQQKERNTSRTSPTHSSQPVNPPQAEPKKTNFLKLGLISTLVLLLVSVCAVSIFFWGISNANNNISQSNTAPPAIPTLGIGSTQMSSNDGMKMVYVPGGSFKMGSDQSKEDEKPEHMVTLDPFWIDINEVTNVQYRACVTEKACQPPIKIDQFNNPAYDRYPVVYVSWDEATNYCHWAGRRLPSEAEWEKAARGTDGRTYPWGNQAPTGKLVNFADRNQNLDWADKNSDDGFEKSAPAGNYPPGASPYGALDMSGNVWEWVNDWYDPGYYVSVPVQNPSGPLSGDRRVVRGGSWYNQDYQVSVFMRDGLKPDYVNNDLGFRCAQNP